jgi:hypothetical protein
MRAKLATAAAFIVLGCGGAAAQNGGYVINTPGQPLTFVNPNGNGGLTIITPGRPLTFVNPTPNGGAIVNTPGQPLTFINPSSPALPRSSVSPYSAPPSNDDDDDDN